MNALYSDLNRDCLDKIGCSFTINAEAYFSGYCLEKIKYRLNYPEFYLVPKVYLEYICRMDDTVSFVPRTELVIWLVTTDLVVVVCFFIGLLL